MSKATMMTHCLTSTTTGLVEGLDPEVLTIESKLALKVAMSDFKQVENKIVSSLYLFILQFNEKDCVLF
jgi:hypothetical protein